MDATRLGLVGRRVGLVEDTLFVLVSYVAVVAATQSLLPGDFTTMIEAVVLDRNPPCEAQHYIHELLEGANSKKHVMETTASTTSCPKSTRSGTTAELAFLNKNVDHNRALLHSDVLLVALAAQTSYRVQSTPRLYS